MPAEQRVVLWFRNDLRLTDNPTVYHAAELVHKKQASEVTLIAYIMHGATLLMICTLQGKACRIRMGQPLAANMFLALHTGCATLLL